MAEEDAGQPVQEPAPAVGAIALPGEGDGWTKLKGKQGWKDKDGNLWKKDQKHKDHWDVSDEKTGKRVREVDFRGVQLWPEGPKNKNRKKPK